MTLEIHNYNNTYQLSGALDKFNLYAFRKEFLNVFDKQHVLIINIEALSYIDRYGVNALAQLHNEALVKGKKLSIIGMGNVNAYQPLKAEETAA